MAVTSERGLYRKGTGEGTGSLSRSLFSRLMVRGEERKDRR